MQTTGNKAAGKDGIYAGKAEIGKAEIWKSGFLLSQFLLFHPSSTPFQSRLIQVNELRFLLRESWTQNSGGTESSRNKSRVELNPRWDARLQFSLEREWFQRLGRLEVLGENCHGDWPREATGVVVEAQKRVFLGAGQGVGVAPEAPGAIPSAGR